MATTETRHPRERWWSETTRVWVSTVVSVVGCVVLTTGWIFLAGSSAWYFPMALGTLIAWTLLVATHAALTSWAFRGLAGAELRRALSVAGGKKRDSDIRPSWSVQIAIMALIAVVVLVMVPDWREQPILLGLGLAMVVAAWADMGVAYAMYYASVDEPRRLVFEDDEERAYSDYLYVAFTLQTTFAVSDVGIRTRALRSKVTTHSIVAFAYNTVTVGMIVALLISSFTGEA